MQTYASRVADRERGFSEIHPAEWKFLTENTSHIFACSLRSSVSRYGGLTDRQMVALRNCMDAAESSAAKQTERLAAAPAINISKIEAVFSIALKKGIRRPRLRLGPDLTFSPASATGINPGAIYVKSSSVYLGKIIGGKFLRSRDCPDELVNEILDATANPEETAIAYGKRFGRCSICCRVLSNKESIDRGIGPICAASFGW